MISTANWDNATRSAVREMANGGELYIYLEAGDACVRPPQTGSGAILGDNGRTLVSRRTIRRLRQLGLTRGVFPEQLRDDRVGWAALIADGHSIDLPNREY